MRAFSTIAASVLLAGALTITGCGDAGDDANEMDTAGYGTTGAETGTGVGTGTTIGTDTTGYGTGATIGTDTTGIGLDTAARDTGTTP